MTAQQAQDAKARGNKLFQEGRLEDSIKEYKKAVHFDPKNPIYLSNLSAGLYEAGKYAPAIDAILLSWSLKPEDSVAKKLSVRLAKSLALAIHEGAIKPDSVLASDEQIEQLRAFAPNDDAWGVYDRIVTYQFNKYEDLAAEAKNRFSKLPILRGYPDPTQTFWVWGTDRVFSLLDGWGVRNPDPVKLETMTPEQLARLSVLVGGVGDAKHAFGTVIGAKMARDRLPKDKRKHFKLHMTCLDVHLPTVARDLLLFMFLDQLTDESMDADTRLEVMTTLFYVYIGWLMPPYCYDRWIATVQDLETRLKETPPRLPSYLVIDPQTIPRILDALKYWLTSYMPAAKYVSGLEHQGGLQDLERLTAMGLPDPWLINRPDALKAFNEIPNSDMKAFAAELGHPNVKTVAEARKIVHENKEEIIRTFIADKLDKNIGLGMLPESTWFRKTKVHIPPRAFWNRHSGFQQALSHKQWEPTHLDRIGKSIRHTWKSNMSSYDGSHGDKNMDLQIDMFGTTQNFAAFLQENRLQGLIKEDIRVDSPAFAYVSAFFEAVIDAIKSLRDVIKIEFVGDEIHEWLQKIRVDAVIRDPTFPKEFTRIWMSNIPDFTNGTINMMTYILPALQKIPTAAMGCNCMFNSNVWKSDEEYCYNYTMLFPNDLKRYFGMNTKSKEVVMGILSYSPSSIPKALATLPPRDEFRRWLTKIFLSVLHPGYVNPRPRLIKMPNTLVAFTAMLVELRNIGYPTHWIQDFLQSAINNTLFSDTKVYQSTLPRPVHDKNKVVPLHPIRVDPWFRELETILAIGNEGFPFATQMPPGFATHHDEIGTFKTTVQGSMYYTMFYNCDAVAALVFYKPGCILRRYTDLAGFLPSLSKLIHNEADAGVVMPPPGTFHIFTSQEYVDIPKGEVRWKMGKAFYQQMVREKWNMAIMRMDFTLPITYDSPASTWVQIS